MIVALLASDWSWLMGPALSNSFRFRSRLAGSSSSTRDRHVTTIVPRIGYGDSKKLPQPVADTIPPSPSRGHNTG
jgi:hypothetical protein